ncbi:putative UPF0554 protein C2orf43 like protein [Cricetulus griseus]|nr:putative UPF0554 protein C2orf43 like protein [Cricetulus griseus]
MYHSRTGMKNTSGALLLAQRLLVMFLSPKMHWYLGALLTRYLTVSLFFNEANAAHLLSQEMIHVQKRDDEIIMEHLPKLTLYYGKTDSWCPVKYYEDMRKDFPEGNIRLCILHQSSAVFDRRGTSS